jgi:hypothetical protein
VNLWLGNNPVADGVNPFVHGPLAAVAQQAHTVAHNPVEADTFFRQQALSYLSEHPGAAWRLAVKKLVWTFTARELPNAADIARSVKKSWLFSLPFFPLSFGVVLPAAAAGAARWSRGPTSAAFAPTAFLTSK